jgi:3-oxosteroid 1-dehydrogenase
LIERSQGLPDVWDEEVDLVVIGSGSAGMTGALVAAVGGASVLVLEKTELVGGTTAVSGGGLWVPLNRHASEVGVDDNREDALTYLRACAGGAGDDEVLVALVDHGADMISTLEEQAGLFFRPWPSTGTTIDYRPELPGSRQGGRTLDPGTVALADLGEWAEKLRIGVFSLSDGTLDRLAPKGERHHILPLGHEALAPSAAADPAEAGKHVIVGSALAAQLLRACLEKGVSIVLEAPAKQILIEDGRVVGVRAEKDGKPFFVRALGGVLMGTGGFSHNEELKRMWLERPLEFSCEIEENQGDGHLMGMAVGAQTAGLGDAWWSMRGAGHMHRYVPHTLVVNSEAKRFCDEGLNYYDFGLVFGTKRDSPEGRPKNLPAWLIFDSQGTRKYSVLASVLIAAEAQQDDSVSEHFTGLEVAVNEGARVAPKPSGLWAPTTLTQADTLEELGQKLGIDGAQLAKTIEQFNGYALAGHDPDFHRGESRWILDSWGDPDHKPNPSLGTLEEGPFYALEIRSGALATRGGLRVTGNAEVVSAQTGDPIPGLYAAGNCSNGAAALAYPGPGSTIGAAMTFGYIAARQVLAQLGEPARETARVSD